MKAVIDTNIILPALGRTSSLGWIVDTLISKKYQLLVTTDILLEYAEIIERQNSRVAAGLFGELMSGLPNVVFVTVYFRWNLIAADADDNKFSDCAVAGNADYLVTNDAHFNVLKSISFPKIEVITPEVFKTLLKV